MNTPPGERPSLTEIKLLIYEAYEQVPQPDFQRLTNLQHRLHAARKVRSPTSNWSRWVGAGLLLLAGSAAAWYVSVWVIEAVREPLTPSEHIDNTPISNSPPLQPDDRGGDERAQGTDSNPGKDTPIIYQHEHD